MIHLAVEDVEVSAADAAVGNGDLNFSRSCRTRWLLSHADAFGAFVKRCFHFVTFYLTSPPKASIFPG
jgi:hypothetical protein